MANNEIVFLGTGGGRHHIRTQYRATGGILLKINGIQAHIDPGPGAMVRLNQYNQDPTKTELFIVTHAHLDHINDINVVIEGSRIRLHDKKYNYFKKGTLIIPPDAIKFITKYHQNMLEKIILFRPGDKFNYKGIEIEGTKVIHHNVQGFGLKFKTEKYCIGFTSDTKIFNGFSEQYNNVDILVLNLLRPDSITCRRHLCTDEVIPYLNKINPPLKILIITHFGSMMDGYYSEKNHVPSQVEKLKKSTNIHQIIAAEDGMILDILKLLKLS
ncbi:MAG: MBL fold metallo-hydrolase [Promethearchaeia archaeon]